MPLISLDLNLTSQFYIAAYLYAIACLNRLKKINPTLQWHQSGVLALMPQSRWQQIKSLDLPSQLMQCLTQPQVSSHAGMALTSEGIFYPHGGYVNAQQLCSILANESGNYLTQKRHTQIKHLKRMDDGWQLIDNKNRIVAKADTVILANGFTVQELLPANDLKLSKRYGQLTNMPCQESFSGLKMPVCADGYIIPQQNAGSILGASYRLNAQDGKILAQDHVANIQSVNQCFERQIPMETEHLTGRVSYRTTSLDHLPVVGPIPDEVVYHKDYEDIQHGRKSKNYPSGRYLPSLYVSTGHGSRGLVSCFASADYLTSLISRKPLTFSRSTVELLHPARFLIRSMKKSR